MKNDGNRPNVVNSLLNNLWIKILALALALALWIVINSVNDPIKYMTITNVQVKLLNTSMITDQGEVYTVLDDTDVVPVVTVKARRSVIEDLDKDDIYATADIEDMTSLNTVEIKYYSSKYQSDIDDIDGSIENVLLSIESKKTKSFVLQVETSGEVAEGYELDNVSTEQNQVRVSGPESVVSSIASAGATVDISGATGGISTYADVKLYDEDGNTVDTSSLTLNISNVKVTVTVLPLKTVPIEVETEGVPADGYVTNGVITLDPDTVQLAGRTSLLASISSIVISGDAVDLTGCTSSLQTTVNIKNYLPEGITLEDSDFDGTIDVTIGIEQAETADINFDLDDIELENIPEGYRVRISSVYDGQRTVSESSADREIAVTLTGLSSAIDSVQKSSLALTIDVAELLENEDEEGYEGFYTALIQVTVPDGLVMENSLTASIEIVGENDLFSSEMTEEESGEEESGEEDGALSGMTEDEMG